jgi:hypothetical protein
MQQLRHAKLYTKIIIYGFSLMWLTGGVIMGLVTWRTSSTLECQRYKTYQLNCQLSRTSLFHTDNIVLDSLVNAYLEVSEGRKDNSVRESDTYRIVLRTRSNTVFFTDYTTGFINKQLEEKVYKINYFIKDTTQTSLIVRQDMRWLSYGIGAVSCLISLGVGILGMRLYNFLWSKIDNGIDNKNQEN